MDRSTAIRGVLLVVIGFNCLIFPAIVQLGTSANMIFILMGGAMLLAGLFSTARSFLPRT